MSRLLNRIWFKEISILLYLGINNLFFYKYGIRYFHESFLTFVFIYNLLVIGSLFSLLKVKLSDFTLIAIFKVLVVTVFLVTIFINFYVDGLSLNVDRWSAMSESIKALLNNQYPYTALDHLDKGSSNLPSIFIIGLPFYLMGNVGLLQSFSFLIFSSLLYFTLKNAKAKLFGLFLLIFSVFYWWEVYVKSDLMTNFILILSFILLSKIKKINFSKPSLLGFISGFLLYTRIVAIIPLTLLLFRGFIKTTLKGKIKFIISSAFIILMLTFFVLKNCPSIDVFLTNNPFLLQKKSSQFPVILSLLIILSPFYFASKIKDTREIISYSLLFLSITVLLSFCIALFNNGFIKLINNHSFDISYFNIITPFLIYYISLSVDNSRVLNISK